MHIQLKKTLLLLGISVLLTGPAFAKKPENPGNSDKQHSSHHQEEKSFYDDNDSSRYFNDVRMQHIKHYYSESAHHGKSCPPGLAKKQNGCQPPGQEKKWHKGDRLSRDVIYYDLPNSLLVELGHVPAGQKIVRVGKDVLLISIGTGMILEALNDLDDIF